MGLSLVQRWAGHGRRPRLDAAGGDCAGGGGDGLVEIYAAAEEGFGGLCTDLGGLAYYAFTARRDRGQQTVYAMLLNRTCTWEALSGALQTVADAMGKRCNWYVWCRQVDGSTYCRIDWAAW